MATREDPATVRRRWHEAAGAALPLEPDSVFLETEGWLAKRANERRAKLLRNLAPLLDAMLYEGETIRYAVRGVLYSAAEYMLSGHLAAMHANQMAIVLTSHRLLWLQVDGKGRPRDLKNQVRLEKIRRVTTRWIGPLTVETVAQEKLVFTQVPKADRKALVAMIPGTPAAPREKEKSVEHLCPSCARVVPGPVGSAVRCPDPSCRIPFRSPKKAAWLSALVPGVGDIYLRHFAFGSLEFVGSIAVLCVAIFAAGEAFVNPGAESLLVAALLGAFFVVLPRVIDFALTLHMGRKGIVPLSLTPAPAGIEDGAPIGPAQPRPLPAFPAWSWVLFALGAAAVAATGWFSWSEARAHARLLEACRLAESGKVPEATRIYDALNASSPLAANDRGRFALALWNGGDLDGGDRIVDGLGPVETSLADGLNAFVAKYRSALEDLETGRKALVDDRVEEAWGPIDGAVALFRTLETAPLPKSRHDVVVELTGELLGPPLAPADLEAAARLAGLAATLPGADARLDVARLRIDAAGGSSPESRSRAELVDAAKLDPLWRLLLLETRVALAEGADEVVSVARGAEMVAPGDVLRLGEGVRANARVRRGALLILAGKAADVPDADREGAEEIAAVEGWAGAGR